MTDLVGKIHAVIGGATFGAAELRAALAEALDMPPEYVRVWGSIPGEETRHGRDAALRIEILWPYPLGQ